MQRLGLDYDTLAEINPRLIMLSFWLCADNADSHRAAYAHYSRRDRIDCTTSGINKAFPTELPLSVADTNAAMVGLLPVGAVR